MQKTLLTLCRGLRLALILVGTCSSASACTTAVISGRATQDGRPILWKNRDYSKARHNEVILLQGGKYRALAVVNAGSRQSVWMGVNEAGFCIENSLSKDLATKEKNQGPGNGRLMKLALETCATVEDFQRLLEKTNKSGRTTLANFGVLDARGGACLFETGPRRFVMFDANDPKVAPDGWIVRSNFATCAHRLPANPTEEQVADLYSGGRYVRACKLLKQRRNAKIDVAYVLRNLSRDLADDEGNPYPGTVNAPVGPLPGVIPTDRTISRTSTVSATVFHGVKPGENPALTTMWTILGDPKFSLAVPCWVACRAIADPLAGKTGGEIGEIALLLRDWRLSSQRDGVLTPGLPGLWSDLWQTEDAILERVSRARQRWTNNEALLLEEASKLHRELANVAMSAMHKELREAKQAALAGLPTAPPPQSSQIRVGIYDHSTGTANGPKNLLRFLTTKNGFDAKRVSPEEIRAGALPAFDVLIVPGGSGSLQSTKLEAAGREAVRRFVQRGGGYVGICAGSYLASTHYEWSLHLIDARVWDRAHWARGTGTVRLSLSESALRCLDTNHKRVDVYYAQGPLLVPGTHPGLPRYETLATYDTEIAKKGAPKGAMVGTHAIIRAPYGAGRVMCFSPHPETKNGPNHLILAGVRWASGRASEPNATKKRARLGMRE